MQKKQIVQSKDDGYEYPDWGDTQIVGQHLRWNLEMGPRAKRIQLLKGLPEVRAEGPTLKEYLESRSYQQLVRVIYAINEDWLQVEMTGEVRYAAAKELLRRIKPFSKSMSTVFLKDYMNIGALCREWAELWKQDGERVPTLEEQSFMRTPMSHHLPGRLMFVTKEIKPAEYLVESNNIVAVEASPKLLLVPRQGESSKDFWYRVRCWMDGPFLCRKVKTLDEVRRRLGYPERERQVGELLHMIWDNYEWMCCIVAIKVDGGWEISTPLDSNVAEEFQMIGDYVALSSRVWWREFLEHWSLRRAQFEDECRLVGVRPKDHPVEVDMSREPAAEERDHMIKGISRKWAGERQGCQGVESLVLEFYCCLRTVDIPQELREILQQYYLQSKLRLLIQVRRDCWKPVKKPCTQKALQIIDKEIQQGLKKWTATRKSVTLGDYLYGDRIVIATAVQDRIKNVMVVPESVVGMFEAGWRQSQGTLFRERMTLALIEWGRRKLCYVKDDQRRACMTHNGHWKVWEVDNVREKMYWVLMRTEETLIIKLQTRDDRMVDSEDLSLLPGWE